MSVWISARVRARAVDPDLIDEPRKLKSRPACPPPDRHVYRRPLLRCRDRTHQRAIVELPVQIHVQALRRRIVDAGNVIPGR